MENGSLTTGSSYSKVASEYSRRFINELEHKPLDRELLERFAEKVVGRGLVCDLGCGPGQITRYLKTHGVQVFGLDLSPGMVEQAQLVNSDIEFRQGDMRVLPLADNSLVGITAFYSIIHIPREQVTDTLKELRRVLQPGGLLLLTFHVGEQIVHLDEWWGQTVALDFTFFTRDEMEGYLKDAGFLIDEVIERQPYPEVEAQTNRVYIFASKPAS